MTISTPGFLKKWLILAVFILALLSLTVCWFPFFIEKSVFPRLAAKSGFDDYQVTVQRIGINGCSLRVTGRHENSPVISAGNIQIKWTVKGLLQRHLDSLVLDSLHVHHYLSGSQESSIESVTPKAQILDKEQPSTSPQASRLPIVVDRISILDSIFFLHDNERIRTFHFSASGQINENQFSPAGNEIQYTVMANIGGQEYNAELSYSPEQGLLSGILAAKINLPAFMRTLNVQEMEGNFSGTAELLVESSMYLSPFSLAKVKAAVRSKDFQIHNKYLELGVEPEEGAVVSLAGNHDRLEITAEGFKLSHPFNASLFFDSHVALDEKETVRWQGIVGADPLPGQKLGETLILSKASAVTLIHEGSVKGRVIDIQVSTSHQSVEPEGVFELSHGSFRFSVQQLELESHWVWQPDDKEKQLRASIKFLGKDLLFNGPGRKSGFSSLRFDGAGDVATISSWEQFVFNGGLIVEDGFVELDQQEVRAEGISFEVPVPFPWKDNGKKGDFRAESISMRQFNLGAVRGELFPRASALEFSGVLNTPLLSNTSLEIKGAFKMPGNRSPYTEFSCATEGAQVDLVNFQTLVPAFDSVTGGGIIDVHADMVFQQENVDGELELVLRKWGVAVPKYKLAMQDMNMQLHFPDLSPLRSSPEQKFSIGRITNRSLFIEDLKGVFQVESPGSLFVEKIGGRWSGGRVFTSAFRLSSDKPELDIALFCDRLELSQVLTQLSLADAKGNGKVSGRIPVSYSNNAVFIDDGFLFSTPGEKGNLKIEKSKQLTAGIPEDVPQYSPIHFAGAALRDFEYNWAKLLLVSEEDNLVLKLQIDGKPANPLPYRFDSQQSVFVRIDDAKSGGIDQPVKLDVNFNVPLNELLRYQTTILPILRNIK